MRLAYFQSARLTGHKTTIRPMHADEVEQLYEWATDPEVSPLWGGRERYPTLRDFVADWKPYYFDSTRPEKGRCFTIEADGKPIGMLATNEVRIRDQNVDVDILIGEASCREKGYGTDALQTFVKFLLETVGLHRVSIGAYAHNALALHVYEKVGFKREGVLRESDYVGGTWVDVIVLSILASD